MRANIGTVRQHLSNIFRNGPRDEGLEDENWLKPPFMATDLFAAAASLLDVSGAYHFFLPMPSGAPVGRYVPIEREEVETWRELGRAWMTGEEALPPDVPEKIAELWRELIELGSHQRVFTARKEVFEAPDWWRIAFALMVIADEAATGFGYAHDEPQSPMHKLLLAELLKNERLAETADGVQHVLRENSTIAPVANRDVVCVIPKTHVPEVGCAMRNLSLNLALLPPRGAIKAHWRRPPDYARPDDLRLNVLAIPFPYLVDKEDFLFVPIYTKNEPADVQPQESWGRFEIEQNWLKGQETAVVEFILALIRKASQRDRVEAVVLPEYALNKSTFDALVTRCREDRSIRIKLLVAGASENCDGEKGNVVYSAIFHTNENQQQSVTTLCRPKHHRWRLDKAQLDAYGIEIPANFPSIWWEGIQLEQRELYFNRFAWQSSFTTLICEDLARSEPCHEVIRSIGPSIIFALLMDGPQLPTRWSARYSLGLAEDPGSSVLTLTSRGLINLSNAKRLEENEGASLDWSVALWADSVLRSGEKVSCPPGEHAVLLKLVGEQCNEITLDGRASDRAMSWRLTDAIEKVELASGDLEDLPRRLRNEIEKIIQDGSSPPA